MKRSRFNLFFALLASLALPAAAQSTPKEPGGVRQDSPGGAAIEVPSKPSASAPADAVAPKVSYPTATTEEQKKAAAKHEAGSQKLAIEQDELATDVVELIEEQTAEPVIKILEEVEAIMAEVTDDLDTAETGGNTIAAETEIIEKIFDAAKKRAQQGNGT